MIAPFPDLCLLIFFSLNAVNWSFQGGTSLVVFIVLCPCG